MIMRRKLLTGTFGLFLGSKIISSPKIPDFEEFMIFCEEKYGVREEFSQPTIQSYHRVVLAPKEPSAALFVTGEGATSSKVFSDEELYRVPSNQDVYARKILATSDGLSSQAFQGSLGSLLRTYAHESFHSSLELPGALEEAICTAGGYYAVREYEQATNLDFGNEKKIRQGKLRSHIHTAGSQALLTGETTQEDIAAVLNEALDTSRFVPGIFSPEVYLTGKVFVNNAYFVKENRYWLLFDTISEIIEEKGLAEAHKEFRALPRDLSEAVHALAQSARKPVHPLYQQHITK